MIPPINEINWLKLNTSMPLTDWTIFDRASIIDGIIEISSGGAYAGCTLDDRYGHALAPSLYRYLYVGLSARLPSGLSGVVDPIFSNSQDSVEVLFVGKLAATDQEPERTWVKSVNLTALNNSVSGESNYYGVFILPTPPRYFKNLTLYVRNRHNYAIIRLNTLRLLRSSDVSGSQVADSIGRGITISGMIAKDDGFYVYYQNDDTPDKAQFLEDANGDFSGINWNNERNVWFRREAGEVIF
jgi:hypothetical protein